MNPKSPPWKLFLAAGLVSLIGYAAAFSWLENRRRSKGPWEITFTRMDDAPALVVHHTRLGLTNIAIVFPEASATPIAPQTVRFEHGQVAPLELPFGRCVFMDTAFLPGTVACEVFGHEIQIMPRVLTIDRAERPWRAGEKIFLPAPASVNLPAR
jgi:hypothetical protein